MPSALRSIVLPGDIAGALADSANLDDVTRMNIGAALLTGDGAPRSIEAGARILLPLATNWSGEAATILARAYQSVGRNEDAYEMALIAVASGDRSALVVADELEQQIPLVEIMTTQDDVSDRWPGTADFDAAINAAVADGDAGAIARHAHAASVGRDLPRSFSTAYMLATLAAAAGDHGADKLRDRLDRRFGGDTYWQAAAGEASEEAMTFWVDGGMGVTVVGRSTVGIHDRFLLRIPCGHEFRVAYDRRSLPFATPGHVCSGSRNDRICDRKPRLQRPVRIINKDG